MIHNLNFQDSPFVWSVPYWLQEHRGASDVMSATAIIDYLQLLEERKVRLDEKQASLVQQAQQLHREYRNYVQDTERIAWVANRISEEAKSGWASLPEDLLVRHFKQAFDC